MKITIRKNPYDNNINLYKKDEFELNSGVTILTGHNGSGKTTLLGEIKYFCKENKIPCFEYDNYREGSNNSIQLYLLQNDFKSISQTAFHSEGEQLLFNFGKQFANKVGSFIKKNSDSQQLVFLLDALDSGLDVDGIDQILNLFKLIISDFKNKEIYIVASANNYAMIHKQRCLDVKTFKEIYFDKFEDYQKYINNQYKKIRGER